MFDKTIYHTTPEEALNVAQDLKSKKVLGMHWGTFVLSLEPIMEPPIRFKDSDEGFIKNWPPSYDIRGWLVSMQKGGKLASHIHGIGWITGSININVPPKLKSGSGNLVLCMDDLEEHSEVDSGREIIIDVTTGSLCFFPSSLHHYTIPFEEEEDRIVLAFDVVPRG